MPPDQLRAPIRKALGPVFPNARLAYRAVRWRRRLRDPRRVARAQRFVVAAGPFRGLKLSREAMILDMSFVPKLLGAYEAELHQSIETAIACEPDTIVNVGAGDGYYAAGLARRLPSALVIAYDLHPSARRATRNLARANGVYDRLSLKGECRRGDLAYLDERTFLVMDCEGAEGELLGTETLGCANLIVELHEHLRPGVTEAVSGRFAGTHDVRVVFGGRRDPAAHPGAAVLPAGRRQQAVQEPRRARPAWAIITRR